MAFRSITKGQAAEKDLRPGSDLDRRTRNWVREVLQGLKSTPNDGDVVAVRDRTHEKYGRWDREYVTEVGKDMLLNGEWTAAQTALEKAKKTANEWQAEGIAARNLILKVAFGAGLDLSREEDLVATIVHLGQKNQLNPSEIGRQRQAAAAQTARDIQERARLTASITLGKEMFDLPQSSQKRLWRTDYGRPKAIPSSTLDNESLEDLRLIAAEVADLRKAKYGTTAAPETQQDNGLEASVPAQRIPAEPQDEFLASATDPSREYTRKELMSLSRGEYNRLLFNNGQSRGAARRNAIERILRGQPYRG
jgi:hypothetical protein